MILILKWVSLTQDFPSINNSTFVSHPHKSSTKPGHANFFQAPTTFRAYCVVLHRLDKYFQAPGGVKDKEGLPRAPRCQREQIKRLPSVLRWSLSQSVGTFLLRLISHHKRFKAVWFQKPTNHEMSRIGAPRWKTVWLCSINPFNPKNTKPFAGINAP